MANKHNTFLQIPNDVDDPIVLRRVLDSIVIAIDEMRGDRGDSAMATAEDLNNSQSSLVSTASSLTQLVQDVNGLDNNFLRIDGKNVARAPLSYASKEKLSGLNFASVTFVEDAIKGLKPVPTPAPALLAGDVDPANMSAKIDQIITALITAKVLI